MIIKERGFTLIELLISVTILTILAGGGIGAYLGLRNRQLLRGQVDTIVADARWTISSSRAQEGGDGWGMHFENSTGTISDFYEIWRGASYSSSTIVRRVSLSDGILFSDPSASSTKDIIFSKSTGLPMESDSILITSLRSNDVGEVHVNNLGRVVGLINDGLVGYWPFAEGAGVSTADATLRGNGANLINNPTWAATSSCKVGRCILFDGVDDHITVDDPSDGVLDFGTNSFSYGMWVYILSDIGSYDMPWWKGGSSADVAGYDIELGTGPWKAHISDGTNTENVVISSSSLLNQWVFIMAVVDRENDVFLVYRNGVEVATTSLAGFGSVSNSEDANIGDSFYVLNGYMDDIRVYDKALSLGEVRALHDATK